MSKFFSILSGSAVSHPPVALSLLWARLRAEDRLWSWLCWCWWWTSSLGDCPGTFLFVVRGVQDLSRRAGVGIPVPLFLGISGWRTWNKPGITSGMRVKGDRCLVKAGMPNISVWGHVNLLSLNFTVHNHISIPFHTAPQRLVDVFKHIA